MIRLCTAALFVIAKVQEVPKCPQIGNWLSKLWCINKWRLCKCEKNEDVPLNLYSMISCMHF